MTTMHPETLHDHRYDVRRNPRPWWPIAGCAVLLMAIGIAAVVHGDDLDPQPCDLIQIHPQPMRRRWEGDWQNFYYVYPAWPCLYSPWDGAITYSIEPGTSYRVNDGPIRQYVPKVDWKAPAPAR